MPAVEPKAPEHLQEARVRRCIIMDSAQSLHAMIDVLQTHGQRTAAYGEG